MKKSIKDLVEGDKATVLSCEDLRFMEEGFVEGTQIEVYKKFPGITCVYLRGAIIAARDKDYEKILVKRIDYK